MKHCITSLLSGVAIMAGTLSANAQWIVTPEMGSTVETLPCIELRSGNKSHEIALDQSSNPAVTITKDGQAVTNITASYAASYSDYYLCNLNFTPEITEPGEYIISIPRNSVSLSTSDGEDAGYLIDFNMNISYTVKGKGGDTPVLDPVEYTMPLSWTTSTTLDVSGDIYPGNIQLPDGAKAVTGASAYLRNTSVGYMEEAPVSAMQMMPGMNFGMVQLGQVAKPVYNGKYTLMIPKGTFGDDLFIESNGQNGVANDEFTVELTVTGGKEDPNAPVEPGQDEVSYTLEFNAIVGNDRPQDVAGDMHAIAIQYPADVNRLTSNTEAVRLVNIECGYDQEVNVRFFDANFMGGDLSQLNILLQNLEEDLLPTTMGTYSLIIPQGIVGNADYISSNGEKGIANASFTLPVIFTDSKAGLVTEVTIERIQYRTDKTFDDLEQNQEWAEWVENSKLVFKTDNNDAIGYLHLTITDKNPLNPDEAIVRTLESHARRTLPEDRGVFWKDGEDPFLQLGRTVTFLAGHEYEIKGEVYDFENPPYERTQLAEFSYNIVGTTPGYQYALDIEQVSIEPNPETFIIQNVEQGKFTVTYSAPVRLNKVATLAGNMGTSVEFDLNTVVYNEDHTAFTVTIPTSVLNSAEGEIPIALYVSDLEGHSLFFGADMGDDSYCVVAYKCYMGAPKLLLYPTEEGPEDGQIPTNLTVEEIKDLYISAPGGPASGEIHWSYMGVIKITDLSGDRVFATFDMNKLETVKSYYNSKDEVDIPTMFKASLEEPITTPGIYVVNVPAATFNLGSEFDSSIAGPTFLTLTIEGEDVDNTVYDFRPVKIAEALFNEAEDEATITLTFPENVEVNSDTFAEITLKNAEGETIEGAQIESKYDMQDFKLWNIIVKYAFEPNTIYTVDVPKGVFGDEEWGVTATALYLSGRANPEFTITLDATKVGVAGISAEDSEAVYYNLQGVRVENPENGIYVCVKNGKATKVNIRK